MKDIAVPIIDLFNLGAKGLQHHGLRRANERAVLTVVGFNPGLSNAEIARMSGLAPQTVSAILNDVEALGLIERGEVLRGRRGQPATPIFLSPDGGYGIGVELGWRHADIVAINMHAAVIAHRHLGYAAPDLSLLPGQIADAIADMVRDWPAAQRARLSDVGIGLPAAFDATTWSLGADAASENDQAGIELAAEIGRLTGLPVTLLNDGSAACWAELIAQPAPRPQSFVYLMVSTYLGAGLIGEGRLWQGPSGHSADLGAMLVGEDETGPLSAHAIASVSALAERATAAGLSLDLGNVGGWDWAALEPVLDPWLDESARALALVIFNTNAVIEGGLAVLDTILPADITARLVARVREHFARLPAKRDVEIVPGTLGRLAPALGAAELPLYRRYFSRNLFEKSPAQA